MLSPRGTFDLDERQRQRLRDLERRTRAAKAAGAQSTSSLGAIRKKAETITGDGTQTEFTIQHNFDTRDLIAQARQATAPYGTVDVEITLPTERTAKVTFDTAPAAGEQVRVVILV